MSSREHTARVFQWLDNVAADPEAPSSAFRVAYVIGQHLNAETWEAFPSTDTIAVEAGLGQTTVRAMIGKLIERGHLAVDFGSPGRGHPNKYRPIRKERTSALLKPRKERTSALLDEGAKERFSQLKEPTVVAKEPTSAKNHLLTTVTTKRAASPPALVDGQNLTTDSEAADDAPLSPALTAAEPDPISAPDGADIPDEREIPLNASDAEPLNLVPHAIGNQGRWDMRIIDEAGLDAVKQTPGYRESEFQLLREVHVNPDDEAGSRIAFCAALRESPDIRGTVNALLAYAEWYRTWVANHAGMKTRTIAQFIDAGLWRKFRVRKENA